MFPLDSRRSHGISIFVVTEKDSDKRVSAICAREIAAGWFSPGSDLGELRSHSAFSDFGIVGRLSAHSIHWKGQKTGRAASRICGDGALTSYDVRDTRGRDADLLCEPILANSMA